MWGTYNATGPEPVMNVDFMRALRAGLGRGWQPPVPAWLARLGGWMAGADGKLALSGRRCIPWRLLDEGFRFRFGGIEAESRLRPLARRRRMMARPPGVAMRARNPCLRFRLIFEG